jgi:hypothetical protein
MCVAGAVLVAIGWAAGPAIVEQRRAQVRKGWVLVPAVVTAADVKEGEALTHLERRDIPQQLVTGSLATDPQALVGKRATVALPEGTPVHLGAVGDLEACR